MTRGVVLGIVRALERSVAVEDRGKLVTKMRLILDNDLLTVNELTMTARLWLSQQGVHGRITRTQWVEALDCMEEKYGAA